MPRAFLLRPSAPASAVEVELERPVSLGGELEARVEHVAAAQQEHAVLPGLQPDEAERGRALLQLDRTTQLDPLVVRGAREDLGLLGRERRAAREVRGPGALHALRERELELVRA